MSAKKTSKPRTGSGTIKADPPAPPMESFFTRGRANEGVKVPLYTPDGQLSKHWLVVRGVDSDAFNHAKTKQTRRIGQIASLPEEERDAEIKDATLEMISSLVASWSFDRECTLENIKAFLTEAPQIADKVDEFASKRSLFFQML
jgi:hypothetical protein